MGINFLMLHNTFLFLILGLRITKRIFLVFSPSVHLSPVNTISNSMTCGVCASEFAKAEDDVEAKKIWVALS